MDWSRTGLNPSADCGPVKKQMATKIESGYGIWAAAANLFSHPCHVGAETRGHFFNKGKANKEAGGRAGVAGNGWRDAAI